MIKKFLFGMVILVTMVQAKITIVDEVGLLSKEFIKEQEKSYKDPRKEIVVLVKESIGDAKPMIYGADYFRKNDLGGEGSGIILLIVMDTRTIATVIGCRVEEIFTDSQIDTEITKVVIKEFKLGKFELGVKNGILNSKKILNEVIY